MLLIVVNSITFSHRAKYIWAVFSINKCNHHNLRWLCLTLNLTFVWSSETCTCDNYTPEMGQLFSFFHSTALCQNCDVRRLHTICSAWMRYSLFAAVATKSCVILDFISDLCTVTLTITKAVLWLFIGTDTFTGKCPECLSSGRNPVWGLHSDFHLFAVSFYHDRSYSFLFHLFHSFPSTSTATSPSPFPSGPFPYPPFTACKHLSQSLLTFPSLYFELFTYLLCSVPSPLHNELLLSSFLSVLPVIFSPLPKALERKFNMSLFGISKNSIQLPALFAPRH